MKTDDQVKLDPTCSLLKCHGHHDRDMGGCGDSSSLQATPVKSSTGLAFSHPTVLVITFFATIVAISNIPGTAGIDCFKCVSLNGNNPSCEDPFHNNYSISILESPCMGGRKGRNGLFPATACIKLAGKYSDTGETITVRGCELDSGTLNVDTEIIRMSHCGSFYLDDRYIKGCLQSCDDADGCNHASRPSDLRIPSSVMISLIGPLWRVALFHRAHYW